MSFSTCVCDARATFSLPFPSQARPRDKWIITRAWPSSENIKSAFKWQREPCDGKFCSARALLCLSMGRNIFWLVIILARECNQSSAHSEAAIRENFLENNRRRVVYSWHYHPAVDFHLLPAELRPAQIGMRGYVMCMCVCMCACMHTQQHLRANRSPASVNVEKFKLLASYILYAVKYPQHSLWI